MKFLPVSPWIVSCLVAVALGGSLKVPGESPIEFCNYDRDDDLVDVQKIDIDPNPPKPGKPLNVTFAGEARKTITKGSYIKVTVKYGLIQLISTTADLCEQMGNVDLSCPLEAGKINVVKSVDLPAAIPPGTYNVFADIYSDDDEQISCMKASVNFPRPSLALEEEL
ncbi:MD-2-related lipid-recognition [Akanthomyces lecanii RCEF 1005]|uniref:Phosphatidylglycerol/phosphatidylinositol transfer protein n=1 Tax=Akanthomyces lecanii RCEF 1005 TaxID=1081108 RepID=A0A168AUQ4_CORDF|nr:MD-2-related lipid-recognition [Akanthomyces lecanii RCEF 1005]